MKEFIEFIAKHLVDNPESVEIDEKTPEEKKVVLEDPFCLALEAQVKMEQEVTLEPRPFY